MIQKYIDIGYHNHLLWIGNKVTAMDLFFNSKYKNKTKNKFNIQKIIKASFFIFSQ